MDYNIIEHLETKQKQMMAMQNLIHMPKVVADNNIL